MLLGEKPLLPSVRELYWEVVSSTSAELALLVSPSLRHLSLTFKDFDQYQDHWTTGLLALLRNIVPRATNLSELHLYDLQTDDLSSVISPVGSLHQLTTLEVQGAIVDLHVLETLSRMTSLSDLTLLIELDDNSDPKFCGFPSLKRINITNNSVSAGEIIKVLATFRSKTVIDFAFNNGGGSWSSQQLLAVCRALAKRCPMLERLAATICMPGSDDLAATIAPLNGLRSLRDVELKLTGRLGAPMNYADPLFLMLAASWPCIVSLRLLSDYPDGHVSPLILLAFANACPDLRELCIPILDLPLDMVMGDVSTFPLRDHGLKIMRVQFPSEEIDDDKIFALILDRLFPNIDIDASLASVPALRSGEWDRVLDEALNYCQLVRRNREPETDANKT
ncbi:hypothetical protein K466DRAFT_595627 [Polyporus arcularius HHB13444]|uniref:RNI-like protein n=1 Tax=Polyporus arcularius HHB13444 TaxID=1314778 RepID=A0A5C3PUD2_9APHY|nr:hypothetical protein K466DRAFT_595627 [Polyporus arcularius HHB13444]